MFTKTRKGSYLKPALFLLFTLFSFICFSQGGVYEIKYKFYQKTNDGKEALSNQEYSSLVFYFDVTSPNNVMRTRYYDQKDGWTVVEQKVRINTSTALGKNYYVLDGISPKFITKVSTGAPYNPDNIVRQ